MHKKWLRFVLREQAGEGGDTGGGGAGAGAGGGASGGGDGGQGAAGAAGGTPPGDGAAGTKQDGQQGASGAKADDKGGKPGDGGTPTWPDDWQARLAKGDEKLAKRFARYASPEAMAEALIAAQNRISSGELRAALPKDAKPEELAQWRKENGIPESPDKYDLKFDSGLVIGADDKPIIDGFLKAAHEQNYTPDQAKNAVEWYYQEQKRQSDERATKDEEQRTAALDSLNAEWGTNFRRNINMVEGLLSKFPDSVRDLFKGGRLADGTAIMNNPEVLRSLVGIALEVNPAGTIVPAGSGDPMKGVEERISAIEDTMRKNRSAYNKDEKMQAEYRELLQAREKLKQRAAA